MSNLTFIEKRQLEKLFGMGSGYVLNFSDRTFQEFVIDSVERDVYEPKYNIGSGSKANRLRGFWDKEPDHVIGKLTKDMVDHVFAEALPASSELLLADQCRAIAARLLLGASVPEIEAITPNALGRDFEALAKSVRDSIDNNNPEAGLDRLHTFVVKYIRSLCEKHNLPIERSKPLHSTFGEYIKFLRANGRLQSEMTERILKSTISVLESFNFVRNNQSFAHDNELLNYSESLLIFNNVSAFIRFLQALEAQDSCQAPTSTSLAGTSAANSKAH